MSSEWKSTTVGEEVTLQRGFDITKAEQRPGRVPVVSSGGVASFHDTSATFGPGVVLGRKGVVGSVYFMPSDYWPHDTTLWVKDFHGNDPRFVYYFFRWMAPRLAAMDVGSANPTLNRNHVHPIEVRWPPHPEQRDIAHLLGTLDDKIELNQRMNETLEGIARSIFKSWFVDFHSVRARMESRRPLGMDSETAGLLPSAFEESSRGLIPSGWKWVSIAGIARYVNGRNFTKDATGFGRMVIRIAELNSGPGASTVFNHIDAEPENIAQPDDVLFAWSGSLGVYRWHRDEALINQHIFKVVCDEFPKWFVFYQLQEAMGYFREIASHKATTMGHIKRGHLDEVAITLPPEELLIEAGKTIDPIYRKIHVLERESQILAALRDALMPKLISGEIRIRDAEKMAEATL